MKERRTTLEMHRSYSLEVVKALLAEREFRVMYHLEHGRKEQVVVVELGEGSEDGDADF